MTLRFPSDWVQHFGMDVATAYPPALGARFRYYERLRPQRSFSRIVDDLLATDPEFRVHRVGEIFRQVARSFRPLPSADESHTGRAFSAPLGLFDHWVS